MFGSPGRQRLVVGVAAASRFAAGILMGTGLAFYVGRAGGSPGTVGLVTTAYFLGMMVLSPVWGALADVTGRRRAIMVGTGLAATASTLLLLLADSVGALLGVRGLYSVFAVGFAPVVLAVVSTRGGDAGRGRSLGFFNSARAVGFTGGQVAAGVLLGLLAPEGLYLVIAGLSLVSTAASALIDDVTPSPGAEPTLSEVAGEVRRRLLPAVGDRSHLRRNGLRWLYVALAFRNATVIGIMGLMPVYLTGDGLGLSEFRMGALLAINPAGQAVFMVLFGRVADTWGRKPLVVGGMAGSGLFALVAAAATLPATPLGRLLVAAAAFLLIAASFSAMTTGALAFIGDVAPADRESELMGLRSTAKGVGGVVGPVLVGGVATVAGYQVAFAASSLLTLAATLLVGALLVESRGASFGVAVAGDD